MLNLEGPMSTLSHYKRPYQLIIGPISCTVLTVSLAFEGFCLNTIMLHFR